MFRLVRCTCLVFKQSSLDKTISSYLKLFQPKLFCKFRKTSAPFIRENLNNSHKSFSRVVKTNKQIIQQADPFPRTKQKTRISAVTEFLPSLSTLQSPSTQGSSQPAGETGPPRALQSRVSDESMKFLRAL